METVVPDLSRWRSFFLQTRKAGAELRAAVKRGGLIRGIAAVGGKDEDVAFDGVGREKGAVYDKDALLPLKEGTVLLETVEYQHEKNLLLLVMS